MSAPDIQARLIAEPLSRALAHPVIVENRPGASGNIAADLTAKARDGHTFGVIGNGPLTSSQFLYSRLPYDPQKDLAPIAAIASAPLVWVARSEAVPSPQAFVRDSRERGDNLTYGSIGSGSGTHLGMELINHALGLNPRHIPYGGGPGVTKALLAGEVHMALLPISSVQPHIQAGRLRAIAVTSSERSPLAPQLLSMKELGAPSVNIEVWNAVMVPASLPAPRQLQLVTAIDQVLRLPDVSKELADMGWRVDLGGSARLAERIQSDTATYGALVRRLGITMD